MTDHNSSPRAVAEPAIDIADFYVFPSPSRPGQLVLVMSVFPAGRAVLGRRQLPIPRPTGDHPRYRARLARRGRHG